MKKFLSILLSVCIVTFSVGIHVSAESKITDTLANSVINRYNLQSSDVNVLTPLYSVDEEIIAYCVELSKPGFIIYDMNGMVMSRSEQQNSPFYGINKKIYIAGPTAFYYKDGNDYINVHMPNVVVSAAQLKNNVVKTTQEKLASVFSVQSGETSQTRAITSKYTTYTPRLYSYNPTGICMGTAGAILLAYYDDHINGNVAPNRHLADDGVGLTILLASDMYYKYPGVGEACEDAYEWYFATHSFGSAKSYTASYLDSGAQSVFNKMVSRIDANRPVQVSYNDGAGTNHSVCAYGYYKDSSNFNNSEFLCSTGWGYTLWVNASYLYSVAWINA